MANTLAYYDTATITAVKSFIVQAPGPYEIKHLTVETLPKLVLLTDIVHGSHQRALYLLTLKFLGRVFYFKLVNFAS